MRIAINTRFLLKGKMEGFGWFTYETVKRIVEAHPEHEFFFFFDRPFDPKFVFTDNVTPVVLNPPARHPILFKIWFNYSVTRALKKYKIDLFFSPDGFLSLRTSIPQIGVIHDINFEHYPNDLPASPRRYLKNTFLYLQKRPHTCSLFPNIQNKTLPKPITSIWQNYRIAQWRKSTLSTRFRSNSSKVQTEFTNGKPYFIFVGALHPRKNINRLLLAFDAFKRQTNSPTQLLIVGEKLWKNATFQDITNQLTCQSDLHFSGHVSLENLTQLMGSAKALTFVSYFEGFGIPLVEAMMAGTPILCGNKTSLPEVAGDAALYVDPFSVEEITAGLIKIDQDETLRNQLIQKGFEQSKKFNWDFTAQICWDVILKHLPK